MRYILEKRCHGPAQLVCFREHISIKQDFSDNAHRDTDHGLIDVNHLPIPPRLLELFAIGNHRIRIAGNLARMEGRSYQLALLAVELPFANEETVASKRFTHHTPLVKVRGMLDQDGMDVFRLIEDYDGYRPHMEATDIPQFLHQT